MLNKIYSYMLVLSAFLLVACSDFASLPKEQVSIVPTPVQLEIKSGNYNFPKNTRIKVSDESLLPAVAYLQSILSPVVDLSLTDSSTDADLSLLLDLSKEDDGSYSLEVGKSSLEVKAPGYSGIVSAIATIRQLLPLEFINASSDFELSIPQVSIKDVPRFGWRGMMLDSSRHFWSKEEVKDVINLMALYKLNKFHWHLTDDQGWRIEIKKYPLLTEKGAWRKFNSQDSICIKDAEKYNNPDFLIPEEKTQLINGETIYGGFYTQDDIREVVAYAAERGIDVIPEIDMPGHFLAAIEQYPDVACSGLIGWGSVFSSPICPGKDSSLEFCKDIYREVFELFPFEFVHMGGDEVDKANWKKCADCQRRIKTEGLESEEALQAWFVREIEHFFVENGKRLIGWDEVVEDGLSEQSAIMWWRGWTPSAIPTATAEGKNVINTHNENLYFDYAQDDKTMSKLLNYDPVPENISDAQAELILGVQANLWTEWIPTVNRLHYMIMPRMLALSEIAWVEPSKIVDINTFYKNIEPQFKKMDAMNINYRIPDIGGFYSVNTFVEEATLELEIPMPNTVIRYTTDGTTPTLESPIYKEPLKVTETTDFTLCTYRPNGTRSDIVKTKYVKSPYRESLKNTDVKGSGLHAVWYDYAGDKCKDIESASKNGEYQIECVSIPEGVQGNIGLIITGYLKVPADDIYTFSLTSDDGSILKIGEDLIIDNDGPHAPKEVISQVALKEGLHPLEIRYFDHNGGMLEMHVIDEDGNKKIMDKEWFRY